MVFARKNVSIVRLNSRRTRIATVLACGRQGLRGKALDGRFSHRPDVLHEARRGNAASCVGESSKAGGQPAFREHLDTRIGHLGWWVCIKKDADRTYKLRRRIRMG